MTELSSFDKECIAEIRKRLHKELQEVSSNDTDFTILRWLKGYEYDIGMVICHSMLSLHQGYRHSRPRWASVFWLVHA